MKRERAVLKKFFVNEKENEQIKKNMKKANMESFSNYARQILLNGKIDVTDFEVIKGLRFELGKIGNNINQVVKLAHSSRTISKNEIEKIINFQKEIIQAMNEIIENELKK